MAQYLEISLGLDGTIQLSKGGKCVEITCQQCKISEVKPPADCCLAPGNTTLNNICKYLVNQVVCFLSYSLNILHPIVFNPTVTAPA
jgi:hypothetical protein